MKIKARCGTCGREFLLSQIGPESDAPGRCPFCGARFARHYTAVLPELVREAERAASEFVNALDRLESVKTGFEIDFDELLARLAEQIQGQPPGRAAS